MKETKDMKDSYNKYLSSQNWKKKRKEIIDKKGNICSFCFSNKSIQIHHARYKTAKKESVLNRERHGILFPLCSKCHRKWHFYFGHSLVLNKSKIERANNLYLNGLSIDDSIRFCFNGNLCRIILKTLQEQKENKFQRLKPFSRITKTIASPNTQVAASWKSQSAGVLRGSPAY